MLQAMDRVVLAAADARCGRVWERLLGAEPAGSSVHPALGARAHRWRLGNGWLEILVPDGDGIVGYALEARGPHLFAGGFTTADLGAFARHLDDIGIEPLWDGKRLVLDETASGIPGLRLLVDAHRPQPAVGLIDRFYELTDLVADADRETARAAEVLGLDAAAFEPIASDTYGYRGSLTLFDPARLDRLEIITPESPGTTMRRFFDRNGSGLYMAFAETGNLVEIERRARGSGLGHTSDPAPGQRDSLGPHTVFLHPKTLGGMMLGLSRRSYAWTWSGHPERVEVAP
ncbi:MAG: hypothetical protein RIC56_09600 [Pseudomonadales bacterium]